MYQPKSYRKFLAASVTTAAIVATAVAVPVQAADAKFQDVESNKYYTDAVNEMAQVGFIQGVGADRFGTNQELLRRDAAVLFSRVLLWDQSQAGNAIFSDVPRGSYFDEGVALATKLGLIKGKSESSFAPEDKLTRGEMAVLLARAFNLSANSNASTPFTDLNGHPYADAINAVYQAGLTTGATDTTFNPSGTVSRAQFATFLHRSQEVAKHIDVVQLSDGLTKIHKIESLTDDKIVFNGVEYDLSDDVKDLLNSANANALEGSFLSFTSENGVITGIDYVALNKAGTINANGANIDSRIAILNNGVTIENGTLNGNTIIADDVTNVTFNADANNVTVQGDDSITIGGTGTIDKLTVDNDKAEITLGNNTTISNLELPKDAKADDIITNYDDVKDNIKNDNTSEDTDNKTEEPPAAGGGGGGSSTPDVVIKDGIAKVNKASGLTKALANEEVSEIILQQNITVKETINIEREDITFDGNGKTITTNTPENEEDRVKEHGMIVYANNVTIQNLTVKDAQGFNIQFYNVQDGKLENVTMKNAKKGGLLVNSSEVTIENITTDSNAWGGIEVSKSSNVEIERNPKLTVNGNNEHIEVEGNPAIWIDGKKTNDDWVVGAEKDYNAVENPDREQLFFYSIVQFVSTAEELTDAVADENVTKVVLKKDITLDDTNLELDRNEFILDGGNHTLTLNAKSDDENKTADGIYVKADNITIKNLTATRSTETNTDNLIEVYGTGTLLDTVTVTGGAKAGVYVNNDSNPGKELNITFKNITTSGNGWNAGIGLVARAEGSSIHATFEGENTFGEDVAVYTDDHTKYKGTYTVEGIDSEEYVEAPIGNQVKWVKKEKLSFIDNLSPVTSANGQHEFTFDWGSVSGVGLDGNEDRGRYTYSKDGVYLRFLVEKATGDSNFEAVTFSTVFDGMTLQTDGGPVDSLKGNDSGRQHEDWTGSKEDNGYYTKLNGNKDNPFVYYGLIQKGTGTEETRTINFEANETRNVSANFNIAEGLEAGTYRITAELLKQTADYNTPDISLGSLDLLKFTVEEPKNED